MAARRPPRHHIPSTSDTPQTASPTFTQLGVPTRLTTALATHGILTPFPIQAATVAVKPAGAAAFSAGTRVGRRRSR